MNIEEAIKRRYSVRAYQSKEVARESLERVLGAARLAPSAHNSQPWKFIVVQDEQKRKQLAKAAEQSFVAEAPVVIVAVALETKEVLSSGVPAYAVNLAIAIDHITLAAIGQGLGTCWVGAFSQDKVKEILEIPAGCQVIALLPLGFPADRPGPKTRKGLEEIVSWEKYD